MVILEYLPINGGAQRQIASLAPLLERHRIELSIITRQAPGLAAFERVEGVPVHRLPAPGFKASASLVFTGAGLRLLRQLRPDVIHAFSLFSPTTMALIAKRILKVPVVAKVLRGGELGDVARLRAKTFAPTRIRAIAREMDRVVAISSEIDRELASIGIPRGKVAWLPNGVDINRFRPAPSIEKSSLRGALGLPSGLLAVYTGRLVAEKRVDLLIEAWREVRATHPRARLALLGDGPEAARLRARAGEGVLLLGEKADPSPYLRAADLFVLPSATEGLSNALLEAMSTGLPVVATRVGGAPDVVDEERSGLLVAPGDASGLARALTRLLADDDLRGRMGAAARERIERDFSLDAVAKNWAELYRGVAAPSPGAAFEAECASTRGSSTSEREGIPH